MPGFLFSGMAHGGRHASEWKVPQSLSCPVRPSVPSPGIKEWMVGKAPIIIILLFIIKIVRDGDGSEEEEG